jgi:phosphatidylglycerophosphatase A
MTKLKKLKYVPKYDLSQIFNAKNATIRPPFTWYTLIATWFYVGRIPIMPGTLGSLAVYPIYYLVINTASTLHVVHMFWVWFLALFFIGWYAVFKFEENTATHDHRSVVIDEVLGMLLVFCFCFHQSYSLAKILYKVIDINPLYLSFLIMFVIFRYFDISKPFFIRYIEKLRSSISVILDDLVAAVFTALTINICEGILSRFF